ncbi:hypothetical protein [Vineibacter terrae]|uniref:hypothetical protein n=1 Tax=Vineibacter terrae TaxID=2586908 RepID=UPI002E37ABB8|nr:hypothetical protein [Vineibacter terrae]HEX2890439.1 hypothetical protein [Vineibacter terrae]
MGRRTFETPAPWGIGPGPAKLYSIDGALHAVTMWLDLTPVRPNTRSEREMMLTLRDVLSAIPASVIEADLMSAKRAIKGMVKYANSSEASVGRLLAATAPLRPIARLSATRVKGD